MSREQIRATAADIHETAVEAVTENYRHPAAQGFFARHNEAMARVASASAVALLELDGMPSMLCGSSPRMKSWEKVHRGLTGPIYRVATRPDVQGGEA